MNIINDEYIINFFHLETVSSNPDEHRYERRKLITPMQNKFEGKKYNKKLLDENIYQYLAITMQNVLMRYYTEYFIR